MSSAEAGKHTLQRNAEIRREVGLAVLVGLAATGRTDHVGTELRIGGVAGHEG
ncbi:hypothetical protein D3C81_2221780 [compost metagenome]